jgi:hypothetical protein
LPFITVDCNQPIINNATTGWEVLHQNNFDEKNMLFDYLAMLSMIIGWFLFLGTAFYLPYIRVSFDCLFCPLAPSNNEEIEE